MSNPFDSALERVLGVEGGYVNDPRDSGGATRYGITEAVARAHGYRGSMRELPLAMARRIYRAAYWDTLRLDAVAALSVPLAGRLFDASVNLGPVRAATFLQRVLNVLNRRGADWPDLAVDGTVGPATIGALRALSRRRGPRGLGAALRAVEALQAVYYIELAERRPKDESFIFGWLTQRFHD